MSTTKTFLSAGLLSLALLTSFPAVAGGARLKAAQQAVLQHPTDAAAWNRLGRLLDRAGMSADAAAAFQMASDLKGSTEGIDSSALEGAVLRNPADDEAWGDLGDALLQAGERERAKEAFLVANQIDPSDGEWWRALAGLLSAEEVEALLEQRGSTGESADEMVGNIAKAYREDNRNEEALTWFIRALSMDPTDSEWGTAIRELAGPQTFIDMIKEMPGSDQSDELQGDLGDTYWELGLADQACAAWTRAAELDSGDDEWRNKRARCGADAAAVAKLGVSTLEDGLKALYAGRSGTELLPAFRGLLAEEPTRTELRWLVASLEGKSELDVLHELTGVEGVNDEVWGDYGDALYAAGRVPEAVTAWKTAYSLDSSDSEWTRKLWISAHLHNLKDQIQGIPLDPSSGGCGEEAGGMGIRGTGPGVVPGFGGSN